MVRTAAPRAPTAAGGVMLDPTSISPAASAFAIEAELRADPDWLSALPAMTLDEVATRNAFYRRRGVITGALDDRAINVETGWRLRRSVSVVDLCMVALRFCTQGRWGVL